MRVDLSLFFKPSQRYFIDRILVKRGRDLFDSGKGGS
jgi:hypothetical protein